MKVALYARVSSDQQAEKNNSIPSQLRLLHEYADKHNMTVYKEYVDEVKAHYLSIGPHF